MTSRTSLPSPGGLPILELGLRLCDLSVGAKIADIGCGSGAAVEYMNGARGFDALGVDIDDSAITAACELGRRCFKADGASMPFAAEEFDCLLFQCSFSKMENPDKALSEAARILKKGGKALILDFFAKEREENFSGIIGRVEFKEKIYEHIQKAGLHLVAFKDCTQKLHEYWGQLIFDYGVEELENIIGDCDSIIAAKCSYGIFIAQKGK